MSVGIIESLFPKEVFSIISELLKAWVRGSKRTRVFFVTSVICLLLGIGALIFIDSGVIESKLLYSTSIFLTIVGVLFLVSIVAYQRVLAETEVREYLAGVEKEVREHPDRPQAAWELARYKLESYLNRNLAQVRWIFILTLLVMIIGFLMLGYGIFRVYESPENFNPSVLAAMSGIIVEFIAGTFLLIYRSTTNQAREYVAVLERINAVGMSMQILDTIGEAKPETRDQTRAEIAKQLLTLYGNVSKTK